MYQICASKSDIVKAKNTQARWFSLSKLSFLFTKETNSTLSAFKSEKKQQGAKLENTATKVLGSNHAHDSLNKVIVLVLTTIMLMEKVDAATR